MYEVFINQHSITLSTDPKNEDRKCYQLKNVSLYDIIHQLYNENNEHKHKKLHFYDPKEENLLRYLYAYLPPTYACGGLVYNAKREVLAIKRFDKWDLPKGHLEEGETLQQCAIRETQEETGVKELQTRKYLKKTFHIYKLEQQYVLKVTHWFELYCNDSNKTTPQIEEGITKVKWIPQRKIPKMLKNTFENIKGLFPSYYYDY